MSVSSSQTSRRKPPLSPFRGRFFFLRELVTKHQRRDRCASHLSGCPRAAAVAGVSLRDHDRYHRRHVLFPKTKTLVWKYHDKSHFYNSLLSWTSANVSSHRENCIGHGAIISYPVKWYEIHYSFNAYGDYVLESTQTQCLGILLFCKKSSSRDSRGSKTM